MVSDSVINSLNPDFYSHEFEDYYWVINTEMLTTKLSLDTRTHRERKNEAQTAIHQYLLFKFIFQIFSILSFSVLA